MLSNAVFGYSGFHFTGSKASASMRPIDGGCVGIVDVHPRPHVQAERRERFPAWLLSKMYSLPAVTLRRTRCRCRGSSRSRTCSAGRSSACRPSRGSRGCSRRASRRDSARRRTRARRAARAGARAARCRSDRRDACRSSGSCRAGLPLAKRLASTRYLPFGCARRRCSTVVEVATLERGAVCRCTDRESSRAGEITTSRGSNSPRYTSTVW